MNQNAGNIVDSDKECLLMYKNQKELYICLQHIFCEYKLRTSKISLLFALYILDEVILSNLVFFL